jgi:alpha-glucosidase
VNPVFTGIHHDGSPLYVSNASPKLGETVTLRLRVPVGANPSRILIRTIHDGEPTISIAAREPGSSKSESWYSATLLIRNPVAHYRWLITGEGYYYWLNAEGLVSHDTSDAHDFAIVAGSVAPSWPSKSVIYQVFPDRFAASNRKYELPTWAVPRKWDAKPEGRSKNTPFEYFGGDLWGIIERLEHLQDLGVNVLYLTPVFPSGSTHRYDAKTFEIVDPLLGGDEAYRTLIDACHERDIRVIGDITLNHSGEHHEWFLRAKDGDPHYRDFYTFDESLTHGYETWLDVKSLPKFNFRSQALVDRLISGEDSVIRKWLRFGQDGWRVDVGNMLGRQADLDLNHEMARLVRKVVAEEGRENILIAEHFHDSGPDLQGDGWHGGMSYAAFSRPVWSWLVDRSFDSDWLGIPVEVPSTTGGQFIATANAFTSRMPWQSRVQSWSILSSHDTARIRTVVGSQERQEAALILLMALPGTPMVFAGDEIGAEGGWGEDSRTTFPWKRKAEWNLETLSAYRTLISLRRESDALAQGGLRWIHATGDVIAFLRESADERLLIVVSRKASSDVELDLESIGAEKLTPLFGFSATTDLGGAVIPIPAAGGGIWRLG